MGMAMFIAFLHAALHARVWYWFQVGGDPETVNFSVKRYAVYITVMNSVEVLNWGIGMFLPNESAFRPWIFVIGILLNLRLPQGFMPNDFHGEFMHIE